MGFDTSDLDQSIPGLLDGLKTAFFTSLAGMIGSMFLSAFINKKQDERDGGISDINQAAGVITESVKALSKSNTETICSIQQQLTMWYTSRGRLRPLLYANPPQKWSEDRQP